MHHVVFKLNMCFTPPPPVDPITPSNPDDNSPRLQQSQSQWWEGAESKRSPPPLPHPVWSEMEWCCCSSHTFTQQVQWVWVWWGGGCFLLSLLSLEQQRDWLSSSSPLVYASSQSFMWLPHGVTALPNQCKICGGGETGQRNEQIRSSAAKAKQKKKQTKNSSPSARQTRTERSGGQTAVFCCCCCCCAQPLCCHFQFVPG